MDSKEGTKMNFHGNNSHIKARVLGNIVVELSGGIEYRHALVSADCPSIFVAGETPEKRVQAKIVGVRLNSSSKLRIHVQIPNLDSGVPWNRFIKEESIPQYNDGRTIELTIPAGTDDHLNLRELGHAREIGETRKNLGERLMDVLSKPFKLFAVKK